MSAHTGSKWNWTDPIEDCPIKNIAYCIRCHGLSVYPVYGLFCVADQFVHNIGMMLDMARQTDSVINQEFIESVIPEDFEFRDVSIDVVTRVITELELMDQKLPKPEAREFKIPDKLTIPKIKKPFPPL
mgnify:CR=1 FL=1